MKYFFMSHYADNSRGVEFYIYELHTNGMTAKVKGPYDEEWEARTLTERMNRDETWRENRVQED